MVFNNTEWQEYLEINNKYNRNEAKHRMREIRQSKRLESDVSHIYEIDIGESLENEEIEMYLKEFMLNLNPIQRRRFKMYFIDNLTYRQIADIESRNIKSIYESVQAGKKKFLKYLDKHPNKNTPTSLSL
jgi:DNA-directed RNA polymerase specialized sigma24 family protein